MPNLFRKAVLATAALLAAPDLWAQRPAAYRAPRAADGHADLSGIWERSERQIGICRIIRPRAVRISRWALWARYRPGAEVVEGGTIPYKPEALAKRKENFANRWKLDPEVKCYMPGIPRATYMPFPFQIVQSAKVILMAYEYASTNRIINMEKPVAASVDTWMGTQNGHWEGDTLVVDNTGFNDLSWFDRAGDFHSNALHVVERFTRTDAIHLNYEATIEDPQVFMRPWKISMPLYRRVEKDAQLAEFKCVEYAEELLYGDLRKKGAK